MMVGNNAPSPLRYENGFNIRGAQIQITNINLSWYNGPYIMELLE